MDGYVFNPSVFYWINALDAARDVVLLFGIVMLCAAVVLLIYLFFDEYDDSEPEKPDEHASQYAIAHYEFRMKQYTEAMEKRRRFRRWIIRASVCGAALLIARVFIPSKQAGMEMLVAETVTVENLNRSVQQVKEIVDYIVAALK